MKRLLNTDLDVGSDEVLPLNHPSLANLRKVQHWQPRPVPCACLTAHRRVLLASSEGEGAQQG